MLFDHLFLQQFMNYFLFSTALFASVNAWGRSRTAAPPASVSCPVDSQPQTPQWNVTCPMQPEAARNDSSCWDAFAYKRLDLSNITAMYQPGSWEPEYPSIQQFCQEKGNGTFCYQPNNIQDSSCLSMALVRCPEGVLSSCRAGFMCQEIVKDVNITCQLGGDDANNSTDSSSSSSSSDSASHCQISNNNSSISSLFNFTESGVAACWAITDVVKLPEAQNITTTTIVSQPNVTITVGRQAFGYPFASTTTVDCTMTCVSSLPSGLPQPTESSQICWNPSLPYDQMIPKSTCVGPYPPGPMTTVCPSSTASETSSETDKGIIPTSSESASACPLSSSSESMSSAVMTPSAASESSSICPTATPSPTATPTTSDSAPSQMTTVSQQPQMMYDDYGDDGYYGQGRDGQGNDYYNKNNDYNIDQPPKQYY